ncbi:SWR1 complex subunit 2 isoform X3 [Spinacia oleracea]|uniref:SWR1 complex subunit 2 isoform X3 n=1 Tax=Spinacia oleracea TaxID=3562 RepID=A0A9R0IYF2_SPIOL|nr:SWR1 complex subunit 2 isoform X3 [Spinacia oleracea]
MEPSNEEQPSFLDRTSRATRGKRMNKLLDDEVEEDEAFWNQDALLEEENDNEYEAEPEIADEFDSDFNEDESEPDDDGGQNEADAREKRPKKRLVYTGKPQTKKKKKKKDLSKLEESLRDEMDKDVSNSMEAPDGKKHSDQPTTPDHHEEGDEVEGEKSVRKSTRTAVVVRQAEREAIRAALQATTKPVKRKKEGEEKRMSQEEMLLEAAQTEITNLRHLERVLAREEEVKKRAIVHKEVYTGPQMRYSSKNDPQKALCAVTGLPAKYRDPKTGLPYATKEAFQTIRERYAADNMRAEAKLASGDLYDSIIGPGFVGKRKRLTVPHQDDSSYAQDSRRFCRFPAVTDLVSD